MKKQHFLYSSLSLFVFLCACSGGSHNNSCRDGERICSDRDGIGYYQICQNHQWPEAIPCPGNAACLNANSCVSALLPYRRCLENNTRCVEVDGEIVTQQCTNNEWVDTGRCDDWSCAECESIPECTEGDFKCIGPMNTMYVCKGQTWTESGTCPGPGPIPPDPQCENDTKRCIAKDNSAIYSQICINNQWAEDVLCPDLCAFGECTDVVTCTDGDRICQIKEGDPEDITIIMECRDNSWQELDECDFGVCIDGVCKQSFEECENDS